MARVRLARGYTSYFDPITRVHLTLANPEAGVPDHYNLTGLRRAHRNGVIVLEESSAAPFQAVNSGAKAPAGPPEDAGALVEEAPAAPAEEVQVEEKPVLEENLSSDEAPGPEGPVERSSKKRKRR